MKNRTITPDHVVDQLRGGAVSLAELARILWADEEALQAPLAALLASGRIRVTRARAVTFTLVKVKPAKKERLTTSVAAAPAPPPLKGDCTAYAREIRQRVELAMLGRGRQ
jgi:hypothetical protein